MKISASRPRGRPRGFDPNAALDRATAAFLAKGYQATSLDDLTRATGIAKPSLYAAFGDKDALFARCLDRYRATVGRAMLGALLDAPTIDTAVAAFLARAVEETTRDGCPPGCLVGSALEDAAGIDPQWALRLRAVLAENDAAMAERFERAIAAGELPRTARPRLLAQILGGLQGAIAMRARAGADRAELLELAEAGASAVLAAARA